MKIKIYSIFQFQREKEKYERDLPQSYMYDKKTAITTKKT